MKTITRIAVGSMLLAALAGVDMLSGLAIVSVIGTILTGMGALFLGLVWFFSAVALQPDAPADDCKRSRRTGQMAL